MIIVVSCRVCQETIVRRPRRRQPPHQSTSTSIPIDIINPPSYINLNNRLQVSHGIRLSDDDSDPSTEGSDYDEQLDTLNVDTFNALRSSIITQSQAHSQSQSQSQSQSSQGVNPLRRNMAPRTGPLASGIDAGLNTLLQAGLRRHVLSVPTASSIPSALAAAIVANDALRHNRQRQAGLSETLAGVVFPPGSAGAVFTEHFDSDEEVEGEEDEGGAGFGEYSRARREQDRASLDQLERREIEEDAMLVEEHESDMRERNWESVEAAYHSSISTSASTSISNSASNSTSASTPDPSLPTSDCPPSTSASALTQPQTSASIAEAAAILRRQIVPLPNSSISAQPSETRETSADSATRRVRSLGRNFFG